MRFRYILALGAIAMAGTAMAQSAPKHPKKHPKTDMPAPGDPSTPAPADSTAPGAPSSATPSPAPTDNTSPPPANPSQPPQA